MNKAIATFTVLFFVATIFSAITEGGGGAHTTRLNGAITETATVIPVTTTTGFLTADYVVIDGEEIAYIDKSGTEFGTIGDPATRGFGNTAAQAHASGALVYSPDSSILNYALGFNVTSATYNAGLLAVPTFLYQFMTKSLPRLIMWDFAFLASGPAQYFRYLLLCVSVGFLISMVVLITGAVGWIMQNVFRILP